MTVFEDMEFSLMDSGRYDKYTNLINQSRENSHQDYIDNVRYMMAIAHYASENNQGKDIMFIGGMGVLGNLVSYLGTEVIGDWRDTRDLDIVLKNRSLDYLVNGVFDELDVRTKSLSIPHKLTYRGVSNDLENVRLGTSTFDVYFPGNHPREGVKIQDKVISQNCWDDSIEADFFGVKTYSLDPVSLIDMKLNISMKNSSPRNQDCRDIINLLGLINAKGIDPRCVRDVLKQEGLKRLSKIIDHSEDYFSERGKMILRPSGDYIIKLMEEEDEIFSPI